MRRAPSYILALSLGLFAGAAGATACTPAQVQTTRTAIAWADAGCIVVKAATDNQIATLVCAVEGALSPVARTALEQRAAKLEAAAHVAYAAPSTP